MLREFEILDTQQLDEARQAVGERFCPHKLETIGSIGRFHVRHGIVQGKMLSLSHLGYGATVLIEPGELSSFCLVQIPTTGAADITNGGESFHSDLNTGSILNPDRYTKMVWHAECEQLMIYLPKESLRKVAEALFGRHFAQELVFDPRLDFRVPGLARWRSHVVALARAAENREFFHPECHLDQKLIEERIVVDLLLHQPSNVKCFSDQPSGRILNKSTKFAREFIVQNAAKPISLSDIAAAGGVPIRTLQHHFEQILGSSPLTCLRDERLRRIFHELNSGHCSQSVSSVAKKWGFSHFGRLSKHYSEQFGELPSQTRSRALQSRNRYLS